MVALAEEAQETFGSPAMAFFFFSREEVRLCFLVHEKLLSRDPQGIVGLVKKEKRLFSVKC